MPNKYLVDADIIVNVSVEVEAESAEEAIKKVKEDMDRREVLSHAQGEDFELTNLMKKVGDEFITIDPDDEET